jgi:Fic family protein
LERVKISEERNPNALTLRRRSRLSAVHATTAIEGNRLSQEEVAAVIDGGAVAGPARDILEVRNAHEAYEALDSFDPYSVASFLRAHELLTRGLVAEAGAFRSVEVEVVNACGEVLHTGADPGIVPEAVRQLLEWAADTDASPPVASSAVHFMIEYIHPFRDGNGRIGRLWQTLLLSRWNGLFAWMPTETLIHHDQLGYYQALQASQNGRIDAAPFISYMLDVIARALDRYRSAGGAESGLADGAVGVSGGVNVGVNDGLDSLDRAILAALAEDGRLSRERLGEALGRSTRTIERHLAKLKAAARLRRVGPDKTGTWQVLP